MIGVSGCCIFGRMLVNFSVMARTDLIVHLLRDFINGRSFLLPLLNQSGWQALYQTSDVVLALKLV